MKTIYTLLLILAFSACYSQSNHPTVEGIKANCKSVQSGNQNLSDIKCIPQATITLKTTNNIKKIHLKLKDLQSNAQVYEANYLLTQSVQTNTAGYKQFENQSGVIFISPGELMTLKPMKYEIQTEDNQGNLSTVYSEVH